MTAAELKKEYDELKKLASNDMKSPVVAQKLSTMGRRVISFLANDCHRIELKSLVPGKQYFAFSKTRAGKKLSRSVNAYLFDPDASENMAKLEDGTLERLSADVRSKLLYTVAASIFATIDLLKERDQKTPATSFEILCGHLLGRAFHVNGRTQIEVLHLEEERGTLPTDFIFDLGPRKPKFHVPVKTSTRERAIQVFAHQRVLDGVHGMGRFTGLLVAFAETKLDHKRREVVEICLPRQWQLYHAHIAQMARFYYFDVPAKYAALADGEPPMAVKEFAEFFDEYPELARTSKSRASPSRLALRLPKDEEI
ncbi:MAG: hypothetical protein WAO58_10395 [Fimbriimonadaceae bacterium]